MKQTHETAKPQSKNEQNPSALRAERLKGDWSRALVKEDQSPCQRGPEPSPCPRRPELSPPQPQELRSTNAAAGSGLLSKQSCFMLHTADYLEKQTLLLISARLCVPLQEPDSGNGRGPVFPLSLPGDCFQLGMSRLQAAELISVEILWTGHFSCSPSNGAADAGIYSFRAATSIMSELRGTRFLG